MKTNKIRGAALCAILSLAAAAGAQNATVSYLEGEPDLRNGAGAVSPLDYDSVLRTGDSVLTGKAEQVELTQGKDTTIKIKPNTVFTIRELETGAGKEQVLTTTVGAVSMRFGKLAGKEPRVGSVGSVAGIRGTELTVYAGPDGSTLFVVDSGLVTVEAAGATVDLAKDEAVEVSAAGVPGEKFSVIGREKDFAAWADGKAEALLADPVAALNDARIMLSTFRSGLDEWTGKYRAAKAQSDAAVEKMNAIADKAEQAKYRDEQWAPLALQTGNAVLNYRYYALSAFSLRRYVLGPLYVQMKIRNITTESAEYREFRNAYDALLADYKKTFNPYLGTADY